MAENDRIRDSYGAHVDEVGPPQETVGYFLIKRRQGEPHEAFLDVINGAIADPEAILLSDDGIVVILTSYGAAQALRAHPTVELIGRVMVDIERLRSVLAGEL